MALGPLKSLLSLALLAPLLAAAGGCHVLIPEAMEQPVVHNPFPQLSRVAVAPFFNQSDEPTVDGRQFAMAYYAELQTIPGFEVVPLGVVEQAVRQHRIDLAHPDAVRQLGRALGVDAVVVGSITDFSPYYPPRCGMRVEWYATNPGFHPIPSGYGLPWGTAAEEYIPDSVVFEAEMELARAQLATQSPDCTSSPPAIRINEQFLEPVPSLPAPQEPRALDALAPPATNGAHGENAHGGASGAVASEEDATQARAIELCSASEAAGPAPLAVTTDPNAPGGEKLPEELYGAAAFALPAEWPDARGFTPDGPSPVRPACLVNDGPVMTHTRVYRGSDTEFTAALASYVGFQDDARFGGWRSYLGRSEDFIRFCCHLHLSEMLSARGGGGETRVVRRWSARR
ncbi:hypothetical protein Mal64_22740 [Pseudobythopirellula maris]|uniref:Lipoprotein n=1 Tax=Pseudobythopirellula maris TaxID=2527991 RepID=A0A5C5ZNS7_9BACT|nr:hypothetical protein [Pseudobythopirellula maris]TWT88786.1 hypothetical protein Mal64_22740 [Pseudobythopirellula maris]